MPRLGVGIAAAALAVCARAALLPAQPPPVGLTAAATGVSGQVALSWQAPADANTISGYNLYWAVPGNASDPCPCPVASGGAGGAPAAALVTSTSYTTDLPSSDDGQMGAYWVTTVDGTGEGAAAGPVTAASFALPGAPGLSGLLTGYGTVSLTANAAQGTYALAYISVTADSNSGASTLPALVPGAATTGIVLPDCGSLTLSAQAVDVNGDAGPASAPLELSPPCGPGIASFAPIPSTATGEVLTWNPVAGQDTQAYIVAASPAVAPDPFPQALTVTDQTSFTYVFPASTGNLVYRVYAVDPNGVTSAAGACCLDKAYSYAIPQVYAYNSPLNVTFSASWAASNVVGPLPTFLYTYYGATGPASAFTPLTTVAVPAGGAGGVTLPVPGTAPNSDQYFYFSVSDGAVSSSLTPPASSFLYAPALSTPSVSVLSDTPAGVELSWPEVPFGTGVATGYNVYRTDVIPTVELAGVSVNLNSGVCTFADSSSYASGGQAPSVGPLSYAVQAYEDLTPPANAANPPTAVDDSAMSPAVTVNNPVAAAPPTMLTAGATGVSGTVALSWSASSSFNSNANGPQSTYVVYYSTWSSSPQGATSTAVYASRTALTVSQYPSGAPLQDGVLTWFWVAANNGSGPGAYSPAAWAIPYTPAPAPTLSAGVLPYGQGVSATAALASDPGDVTVAAVNLFETPNSVTPIASLDPSALSLTLSAALFPCGTPLTLTAQAVDLQGDTGTPGIGVWLEAPCSPTAAAAALDAGGGLTLAWSQPPGGTGDTYDVYAATGPGWNLDPQLDPQLEALTQGVTALNYTAPASPGQTRWYSVYAVDRRGVTSPASAQVALLEPPSSPQALPGTGRVFLSWTPPPAAESEGLDGYTVYYSSATAFTSASPTAFFGLSPGASTLTVSAAAAGGVTLTGLQDFTPYAFAVASAGGAGLAVSGSASVAAGATTGLEGPELTSVATSPQYGANEVFGPVTYAPEIVSPLTYSTQVLVPGPQPNSVLLAQWNAGLYTPVSSSVFTLYEATDPTSTPQTFNTITPVAAVPGTQQYVSLAAGAPGPAWYFINVTDAAGANADGGDTLDARAAASALFAPNLSSPTVSLLAPVSDGRVALQWAPVPFADSYLVYRATQDMTTGSVAGATYTVAGVTYTATGLPYSALATSTTPATFNELGIVPVPVTFTGQQLSFVDADPVENARNAYEVVPSLAVQGGLEIYGPASNAVTRTPRVAPEEPGFWQLPGGSDEDGGTPTGGNTAGDSGYYLTAAAATSPCSGVLLEWTASGDGSYPISSYGIFRGYSAQALTQVGRLAADETFTSAAAMPSWFDPSPPQPLAGLCYAVSAVDIDGNSSAQVTGTVQAPVLWPAPQLVSAYHHSGNLSPTTGCLNDGLGNVTLAWAPGVSLTAVVSGGGSAYVTLSAGTFPFAGWEIQTVGAVGVSASTLASPGAPIACNLVLPVGSTLTGAAALTETTVSDGLPFGGEPEYIVSAVDDQGNLGMPLAVSVTVPVSGSDPRPLTVTGFSAAPVVAGSIQDNVTAYGLGEALAWKPNAGQDDVSAYLVYRGDASNGVVLVTETAASSCIDALPFSDGAGTQVSYTVEAVNLRGVTGEAMPAPIPVILAPPCPAYLSVTADLPAGFSVGAGQPAVGLQWPDVLELKSGAFGTGSYTGSYNVYRSDHPSTPLPGCVGLTLGAQCADASPLAQASYWVTSDVANAAGGGAESVGQSAALSVTLVPTVPGGPVSLSAYAGVSGVFLTWTAAPQSGAYEYWIYRSSAPLGVAPPYADFLARVTGTAYVDAGVSGTVGLTASVQTEPYYAVAPASPFVVGYALTVGAAPSPPTQLSAFAGSQGSPSTLSATVGLLWAPSVSAVVTGYNVWRSYEGPQGLTVSAFLASVPAAATATSYAYTDVLSGAAAGLTDTVLSYTVMAEGLGQAGACAGPATVTAYDLPAAPVAVAGNGLVDAVDVTWKPAYAPQGVTGYALTWNVLDAGESGVTQVAAGPPEWTLSGLVPGQAVTLTVQALNSAGASPASAQITVTASAEGPPPAPAWVTVASGLSPTAVSVSGCAVVLNVSATGQSALVVYRSPALNAAVTPGTWAPLRLTDAAGGAASPYYLTTLPGTLQSLTDTAVCAQCTYSYAVTALGPLGLPAQESVPVASSPLTVTAYNVWAPPGLTGTAGNALVSLRWSAPGIAGEGSFPLSAFELFRQTEGAAGPVDPGFPILFPRTQTAYADTQVQNAQPGSSLGYNYWLTCLDTQGFQSLSATTGYLSPVPPLAPPTNLTAIPGDDSVILQWVIPQSVAASGGLYNVYRRLTGPASTYGPPLANLFNVGPASSAFPGSVSLQVESLTDAPSLPTSPPNLVTECYALAVVDGSGEGPKSRDLCVTPYNPIDPYTFNVANWANPVVLVNIGAGDVSETTSVQLTWSSIASSGNSAAGTCPTCGGYALAGYLVERSQDGGATFTNLLANQDPPYLVQAAGTATGIPVTYTDRTAAKGESYVYRILPLDTGPDTPPQPQLNGNPGLPYNLKTVQIPSGQNSLYVYRNSFDPMTGGSVNIQVGLQQSGNYWVKIYTLNGEYVNTVIPDSQSFGQPSDPYLSPVYTWNGRNSKNQVVASGVYLIHLEGPGYSADARVAVIK